MTQFGAHNVPMNDRHQTKPYPLRMGEDLRAKLEEKAKEMGRSLNAEIVSRLEASLEEAESVMSQDLVAKFRELVNPAIIEMTRIENEARVALAQKGMTQKEIAEAMQVAIEDRSVVLKAAAQSMQAKKKAKS